MPLTRRCLPALVTALFTILLLAITSGCSHWLDRALPVRDQTVTLDGLARPAQVIFDRLGIPHIRAGSLEDVLFVQGYVTAQDRLFFMDFHRRLARGELAEILGKTLLPIDRFLRTIGMTRMAREEARLLDPETRGRIEAYAAGVNVYIDSLDGARPFGFSLLRYDPAPWSVEDSLALCKGMSWILDRKWLADIMRARLREELGAERAADLLLEAGPMNRPIVGVQGPSGKVHSSPTLPDPLVLETLSHFPGSEASESRASGHGSIWRLPALWTGSNNWVVSGARTETGMPLLANDPHLQHFMISIIYLCHLKVDAEGIDVIGGTFPGIPGIAIGRNDSIAWGFTTTWADSDDLFVEELHPEDPTLYRVGDEWHRVEVFTDRIAVRWARDVDHRSEWTRHGPIIKRTGRTCLALRWAGHDLPDNQMRSFLALNQATNWDEFNEALRSYRGGCFNAVYADIQGNIAYHLIGAVPIRASGDGSVPAPGADSEHDWVGMIPFDELPHVLNPPAGWLATANNKVVGSGYPHLITTCWEASYRQSRVAELLRSKPTFTVEDFKSLHGDRLSHPSRFLRDRLLAAASGEELATPKMLEALDRLRAWDGIMTPDSQAASIVYETLEAVTRRLLEPHLGSELFAEYRRSWPCQTHSVEMLLRDRPALWLPDGYGSYDELLLESLSDGLDRLRDRFGTKSQEEWAWGKIHALRFPWFIDWIFDTGGAVPLGGDDYTVNVAHPTASPDVQLIVGSITGGARELSGILADPESLDVAGGPCLRMIVDFSDLERSVYVLDRGQSEHPTSPHHRDQLPLWLRTEYYPMMTAWERIQAEQTAQLNLVPGPDFSGAGTGTKNNR